MGSALPDGIEAPADGSLPSHVFEGAHTRELGIYLHVPFCASRCGYCDFNTYTPKELGAAGSTVDYLEAARREVTLAARILGRDRPISTIFIGGGTPTMLKAEELAGLLSTLRESFDLADGIEITTEAN